MTTQSKPAKPAISAVRLEPRFKNVPVKNSPLRILCRIHFISLPDAGSQHGSDAKGILYTNCAEGGNAGYETAFVRFDPQSAGQTLRQSALFSQPQFRCCPRLRERANSRWL